MCVGCNFLHKDTQKMIGCEGERAPTGRQSESERGSERERNETVAIHFSAQ